MGLPSYRPKRLWDLDFSIDDRPCCLKSKRHNPIVLKDCVFLANTPDKSRTCNHLLRKQALYPIELRGHADAESEGSDPGSKAERQGFEPWREFNTP